MKVFDWLTQNWDLVRRIGGDKSLDSYPTIIAHLARTKEEYEKYCEFFEPMLDDSSLKRAVEIGINEIKARLKLITKNKEEVSRALVNNSAN